MIFHISYTIIVLTKHVLYLLEGRVRPGGEMILVVIDEEDASCGRACTSYILTYVQIYKVKHLRKDVER